MVPRIVIFFLLISVVIKNHSAAQQVSMIVPLGHSEKVQTAAFSADDKFVITGGADRNVMVWETFTGKKIRNLDNNPGILKYARFSPGSNFIIAGTDSSVRLWSVPAWTLKASYTSVKHSLFSKDGQKLFTIDFLGSVRQINLQTLKTEFSYSDTAIDEGFGTDNASKLLGVATDRRFLIRDIKTGKIIFKMDARGKPLSCFFSADDEYFITVTDKGMQRYNVKKGYLPLNFIESPCDTVVRSRGGGWLLQVKSYPDAGFKVWDFTNYRMRDELGEGMSIYDTILHFSPESADSIIGYHTGELPFLFPKFLNRRAIEISDDGNYIRCNQLLINLRNLPASRLLENNEIAVTAFSRDSRYLLAQTEPGILSLVTTDSQRKVVEFRSHADNIRNTDISADNRLFLTTGLDSFVRIVDLETGRTLQALKHPAVVSRAVFNKGGSQVLTNCYDSIARIWSAVNGDLIRSYGGIYPDINPAFYTNDDSVVVRPIIIDSVMIYSPDLTAEKVVAAEPDRVDPEAEFSRSSPTGRYWLGEIRYSSSYLSDAFRENNISFHRSFSLFAFSPGDKVIALANSVEDSLFVFDIEANHLLFKTRMGFDSLHGAVSKSITQLAFAGNRLFVTCGDRAIRVLDISSGKKIAELPGRFFASESSDKYFTVANGGACSIYDSKNLKLLYTYIAVDSANYIAIDPDFRFEGTAAAKKLLYYVCGNEVVGLDQLKATSWEPDLVSKIMRGEKARISATKVTALQICNTTPIVRSDGYAKGAFNYSVTAQQGGIGDIQLLVNGKMIRSYKPVSLRKENKTYFLSVPSKGIDSFFVTGTSNIVSLKATTLGGALNSGEATITGFVADGIFGEPRLYLLSIGISEYSGDSLRLKYPARDASLFAAALTSSARKLLNTNGKEHVFSYLVNTDAGNSLRPTRYTILSVLDSIRAQARADDILIVFFAGHGMLLPGKQELLLPTTEAESASQIYSRPGKVAISFNELMKGMQQIKANKEILILDVCNSGSAVDELAEATRRDIPSDQQRALDNLAESTGSCILAASAAGQSAYEANLYGQGLLSYSLLSSLKLGNGLSADKFVQVNHWFDESADQVKLLAERIGGRQTPKVFGNANFVVGIVDRDIANGIQIRTPRKVFGKSELRLEGDIPYDKLGISGLVDDQLKSLISHEGFTTVGFQQNYKGEQFFVKGKYSVKGELIQGKLFIVKSREDNKPVHEFSVSGRTNNPGQLANEIAEKVLELMED